MQFREIAGVGLLKSNTTLCIHFFMPSQSFLIARLPEMNNVLLDKNAGSKSCVIPVTSKGSSQCSLLPKAIERHGDRPRVFAEFAVEHDDFILTFDRGFCERSGAIYRWPQSGVVLFLREDDRSVKRITIKDGDGNTVPI